jgi:alpha-glucosidase (family GH31 glycosyl hydrolase)
VRVDSSDKTVAVWVLAALGPALSCMAVAQGASNVTAGNARFEFLTPSLLRMEYSPSSTFVDAPTAVVQKRTWPSVPVRHSEQQGWLIAATSAMTVRYRLQSGPFTAANLEVTWKDVDGSAHSWHPGQVDALNLGGLTYSLDNVAAANLPRDERDIESPVNDAIPGIDLVLGKAKPGLLSRSGYALIDDSATPVWNANGTWIEPRQEQQDQDWYLFVYGHDYRQVLQQYAQLCGPVPMIPRFVLGPWITDLNFEYFPGTAQSRQPDFRRYNQQHLTAEVSRLQQARIPLDTLVLDFAWHNYGWQGGYDWSPLIAHPRELLRWLQARGIKLSLNDHPGYIHTDESILSYNDSHAPEVLRDLGRGLPAKPSFEMDVSRLWSFAVDPHDVGLGQHWYAMDEDESRWRPIRTGVAWQKQGYPTYQGAGWYRATVRLPAQLPQRLYLDLGEVSPSYRIFINGHEATHSPDHWPRRVTYTDIAPYVSGGQLNEIVLRVEPGSNSEESASGILRGPVAITDVAPPARIWFDLSDRKQAEIFMRDLHGPLMQEGVAVWWVDGGSGAVAMPGLNPQLWTNKVFYDFSQQQTGRRAFILGRYGDWGSQRYPGFFTGDTYSEWPVLAYQVAFSARGGNVLVPYISHDIGGFHGAKIDFDLYARWIEFGTFSAILRMHSAYENPRDGNLRMPWIYGARGVELMRKYFTLRTQLLPYLYTYSWLAHEQSMPILRPLYLQYPDLEQAYQHAHEYFFGEQMLVAPVLDPGGSTTIYLPPGQWFDFFSGRRYHGDNTFTAHYAVDEMPVFVRDGAIIPEQGPSAYSNARPLDRLILNVYGSGNGSFDLYEDDGSSLNYESQHAHTQIAHTVASDGGQRLVIEATQGQYQGQPASRSYQLRLFGSGKPAAVSVNGREAGAVWDARRGIAVVELPSTPIGRRVSVEWH